MLSSTAKKYMRDPVNIYFGLFKMQVKFLINFNATSLSTYDFSSLYTTLPHKLIKDKLKGYELLKVLLSQCEFCRPCFSLSVSSNKLFGSC